MKKFIQDYLTFTGKERIAILLLILILFFVFFLPSIYGLLRPRKLILTDTSWISKMKQLEEKTDSISISKGVLLQNEGKNDYQYDYSVSSEKNQLFYFNPNTIPREQWRQLGLPEKTINTIQNYIAKGGQFKTPEDLKRIYGLKPYDYERLLPFIQIPALKEETVVKDVQTKKKESYENNSFTSYKITDINKADTSAFIKLHGIGSKLALRIVNFRDKLGGFYSIEQVKETYGLADSVFQKIKLFIQIGDTPVRKININTASIDELKSHPYIRSNIALPFIAYRNEHGPFLKKEDIKKVMAVTDDIYEKIAPYLVTE